MRFLKVTCFIVLCSIVEGTFASGVEGFFDSVGNAFKSVWNYVIESIKSPVKYGRVGPGNRRRDRFAKPKNRTTTTELPTTRTTIKNLYSSSTIKPERVWMKNINNSSKLNIIEHESKYEPKRKSISNMISRVIVPFIAKPRYTNMESWITMQIPKFARRRTDPIPTNKEKGNGYPTLLVKVDEKVLKIEKLSDKRNMSQGKIIS